METYSLQFEIDASSAVTGSKQFETALSAAAQAAVEFDKKASAAFNNLKTSSAGGFSQLIQNMNRLNSMKFNTSGINGFGQAIQQIKAPAQAAIIPTHFTRIGSSAVSMSGGLKRAALDMRGLENAFSLSYQAGSIFRNMIGSITLGELAKQIFTVGNSFMTFKNAMTAATGSSKQAASELDFITASADKLGAPLLQTVNSYDKFAASARAAGATAEETHTVFTGLSIAGTVLGLSAQQMGQNFYTATEVFSKGILTAKEMRRQFGNSLPGAFQKMEEALKSRGIIGANESLSKLMSQGKITSKALVLLSADLIKEFGGTLPEALMKPGAQLIILQNQFTKMFEVINKSGFSSALGKQLKDIREMLTGDNVEDVAKKIGDTMGSMINAIGNGIQFLIQHAATVGTIMKTILGYFAVKQAFSIFATLGNDAKLLLTPLTSLLSFAPYIGSALVAPFYLVSGAVTLATGAVGFFRLGLVATAASSAIISGMTIVWNAVTAAIYFTYGALISLRSGIAAFVASGAIISGIAAAFGLLRAAAISSAIAIAGIRAGFGLLIAQSAIITTLSTAFTILQVAITTTATFVDTLTASFSLSAIAQGVWNVAAIIAEGVSYTLAAAYTAVGAAAGIASALVSAMTLAVGALALAFAGGVIGMAASALALQDYGKMWDFVMNPQYTTMEKLTAAWEVLKDKFNEASPVLDDIANKILNFFGVSNLGLSTLSGKWTKVFQEIGEASAKIVDGVITAFTYMGEITSRTVGLMSQPFHTFFELFENSIIDVENVYNAFVSWFNNKELRPKIAHVEYTDNLSVLTKPFSPASTIAQDIMKDATGGTDTQKQDRQRNSRDGVSSDSSKTTMDLINEKAQVNQLKAAYEDYTKSRLEGIKLAAVAAENQKAYDKANEIKKNEVRIDGVNKKAAADLKKEKDDFQSLLSTVDPTAAAINDLKDNMDTLNAAEKDGMITAEQHTAYILKLKKAFEDTIDKPSKLSKEFISLKETLDPSIKKQDEFNKSLATLDANKAAIGLQEYERLLDLLKEKYAGAAEGAYKLKDGVQMYVDSMGTFADRFAKIQEDFTSSFVDNFSNMIAGAKTDWAGLIDSMIKGLIKLMVQQALVKLIGGTNNGAGSGFFGGGNGQSGSGAGERTGGLGGLLGNLFNPAPRAAPVATAQTDKAYADNLFAATQQQAVVEKAKAAQTAYIQSRGESMQTHLPKISGEGNNLARNLLRMTPKKKHEVDTIDGGVSLSQASHQPKSIVKEAELATGTGTYKEVGNFVNRGADKVDPRLRDILKKASKESGVNAEAYSGYRPKSSGGLKHSAHQDGQAEDVRLMGSDGKMLPNYQDPKHFRDYEKFAQSAKTVQHRDYPELDKDMRWGGYFGGKSGKDPKTGKDYKYGATDMMHFDLAGKRAGMAGGSFEKGLTPQQRKLLPGAESVGMGSATNAENKVKIAQNKVLTDDFNKKQMAAYTQLADSHKTKETALQTQLTADKKNKEGIVETQLVTDHNTKMDAAHTQVAQNMTKVYAPQHDQSAKYLTSKIKTSAGPAMDQVSSSMGTAATKATSLTGALGSASSSMSSFGSGIMGIAQQLLGSLGGGGGGLGGSALSGIASSVGGLFGFAEGGSMTVGGAGGADTKLAAFKVTPGEQIDIKTPSQMRAEERARSSHGYLGSGGKENLTQNNNGVKIVNVMDPTLAVAAMSSGNGKNAIINAIKANPRAVRQVLRA